jgi:hypothetical protein
MATHTVEYVVARWHDEAWRVLRNGEPVGRRRMLFDALDFATHLAEREATRGTQNTRVLMECRGIAQLRGCHPSRRVA